MKRRRLFVGETMRGPNKQGTKPVDEGRVSMDVEGRLAENDGIWVDGLLGQKAAKLSLP